MGLTRVHRWPGCVCDRHNTTGACDAEPVVCVCETPIPGDVDGVECATCRRPIRERMRA